MGLSGRLCNATPWGVRIPWHRTKIEIPGDSFVELRPEQVDDFRPGKPGSEEVRRMLQDYGCFLMDTDKSYDVQMLECIEACIKERSLKLREFIQNARNERIASGQNNVTEEDLEGVLEISGYGRIRDQIRSLDSRARKLKDRLVASGELGHRKAPKYDMERTCFGVTPPKVFPSAIALDLFLDENPEIAERHRDFLVRMQAQTKTKGDESGTVSE